MAAAAAAIVGALVLSSAREGARMTPDALLAAIKTATAPRILEVRTTKGYEAGHVSTSPTTINWLRRADLSAGKAVNRTGSAGGSNS